VIVTVNAYENSAPTTAPLAAGLVLAALMATFGPVSGAHFNPAFTIGMLIAGRVSRTEAPYYILAQVLGATLASSFGVFILGCIAGDDFPPHRNDGICAIMAEFLGTFIFTLGFLRFSIHQQLTAATVCGAFYTALIVALGPVSFAVFNPAAAVGLSISGWLSWGDYWLYIIGPILGAAAAASVQTYFSKEESTS
jgi:aquaporin Z